MTGLVSTSFAALGNWSPSSVAQARAFVIGGQGQTARPSSCSSLGRRVAQPELSVAGRTGSTSAVVPAAALGVVAAVGGRRLRSRRSRAARCAYASAQQSYEGAPIGPPPDLPSLLLKERIVYLGTPITNEVTELIIAQLLYLNYESADKPITLYINSTGSTVKNNTKYIGENKVGMETDAFAIADCMAYIKPEVQTIAIGQAYGTAAVLLGLGAKKKRFALPNATIMLAEPREPPARGPRQAADIRIMAREVLHNRKTMGELLGKATGKSEEQIVEDTQRCYYMTPDEAVEYGLLDKVLTPEKLKSETGSVPSFVSAMSS